MSAVTNWANSPPARTISWAWRSVPGRGLSMCFLVLVVSVTRSGTSVPACFTSATDWVIASVNCWGVYDGGAKIDAAMSGGRICPVVVTGAVVVDDAVLGTGAGGDVTVDVL